MERNKSVKTFDFSFDVDLGSSILNSANQLKSNLSSKCSGLMPIKHDIGSHCQKAEGAISEMEHALGEEISSLCSLQKEVNTKCNEIKTKRSHLIPPHDETVEVKDSEGNVVGKKTIHVDPDRAQREKFDKFIEKCESFNDKIEDECSKCEKAKSELSSHSGDFERDTIEHRCEDIERAGKYVESAVFDLEREVKYAIHYVKKIESCSSDFVRNAFLGRKCGKLPNIFATLQSRASASSISSYPSSALSSNVTVSSNATLKSNDETKTANVAYTTFRIIHKLDCDELRLNYVNYSWNIFEEEFARYFNQTHSEYIIKVSLIGINHRDASGWNEFVNNIATYGLKYDEKDGLPKLNINKEAVFRLWDKE